LGFTAPGSGIEAESQPLRDAIHVLASGLVAAVGGAFVIRGRKWARWLLVAWMGFHIVLSLLHSASQFVVHAVLFAVVIWLMFRPQATPNFQASNAEPP
jgi:hypothetical protein